MNRQILTITEKNRFNSIINKYFPDNLLFYKSQSGNIEVQYLGNNNGMAEIKFPNTIVVPEKCVLFTSQDETIVISYMAKEDQKSEEIGLYNPSSFQIVSSSRLEKRHDVVRDKKSLLYARNIISEFQVKENLLENQLKIERIKQLVMQNEVGSNNLLSIKFINEVEKDNRIKFFKEFKKPIFITSRFHEEKESRNSGKKYYLNNIYSNDQDLMADPNIISEISIPIMYKDKLVIGYIQVNSASVLSLSSLHNYKRLAMIIENKIIENKVIEDDERGFLISNISTGGICIVFKNNNNNIKLFEEKSPVYFEIMLPFRQKVSISSEVKHIIDMKNDVKKIGLSIVEMDRQGEEFFGRYLQEIV